MSDAYDHNQTLVPDSFIALYVKHERLTLARDALEARHDFAESLALHAAELLPHIADDDGPEQHRSLRRALIGLRTEPAQVSASEAAWVIARIAELRGWPYPAWVETAEPVPAGRRLRRPPPEGE